MTAKEIRKLQIVIDESLRRRASHPMTEHDEAGLGICFWLSEIALQLAETNECTHEKGI